MSPKRAKRQSRSDHARGAPAAGSRLSPRIRLLLGLLFSSLLTITLLEVGTRLVRPGLSYEEWRRASLRYVYHPIWNWSTRPGEYMAPQGTVHINADGLRGETVSPTKPAGTLRVVCLGGSSTFNYGATAGRTWPVLLEQSLRRSLGRPVEVINGGTPGYSSYQSTVRFEHQFANWQPDLVLIYHMWNDLKLFWMTDHDEVMRKWDTHGRFNEASTLLDPFPFLDRLCAVSQFVTHVRFAWIKSLKKRNHVEDEGWIHPALDKKISPQGVDFYRRNLARVARICDEKSIPFLIVDQPLIITANSTPAQLRKVRYEYTGFDPPTLLQAIALGYQVNAEIAEQFATTEHLTTEGFPRDLQRFQDHVHLRDRGLADLARHLVPACAEALRGRP